MIFFFISVYRKSVENQPPTASNTIDQRKKSNFNKEIPTRTKHAKKAAKRNTEDRGDSLIRKRRDPDDLNEENSNFEMQNGKFKKLYICLILLEIIYFFLLLDGWWSNGYGVSVTIIATNVNQTLGPEFCAVSNNEYTHCIDRNAVNSTYHIPLSKYLADEYIIVQFQLKHQRTVMSCQKIVPQTECLCQKRQANSFDLNDSGNTFYVDISNYSSVAVKYRVPLNLTQMDQNICDLQKDGLGVSYLEYNLYFYRDCEE